MDIAIEKKDGIIFLNFKENSIEFKDIYRLNEILNDILNYFFGDETKVIIDLDNIEYIDSSGIGFFMIIKNKVDELNGKLVLVNIKGKVKQAFQLTHLVSLFNITSSIEEAVEIVNK